MGISHEQLFQQLDLRVFEDYLNARGDPHSAREILDATLTWYERARQQGALSEEEVTALRAGGLHVDGGEPEVAQRMADAHARQRDLLASHSLTVQATASALGVSPSRIRQRLKAGEIYGYQRDHNWRVLDVQLLDGQLLPGLSGVVHALPPECPPLVVLRWFTTPQPELTDETGTTLTPRDWLAANRPVQPVIELAESIDRE